MCAHLSRVITAVCVLGLVLEDCISPRLLTSPVTNNSQLLSNESGCVVAECHLTIYYTMVEIRVHGKVYEKYFSLFLMLYIHTCSCS